MKPITVQNLARLSANQHFIARHEGDWYAHYYGFIYGYQEAIKQYEKKEYSRRRTQRLRPKEKGTH